MCPKKDRDVVLGSQVTETIYQQVLSVTKYTVEKAATN